MADDTQPAAPAANEAVPAGSLSEQIDQDLAVAQAALAAEEAAAAVAQAPAAEPAAEAAATVETTPAAGASAPEPAPAGDGRPPMPQTVPIERFNEVIGQRNHAAENLRRAVEDGNASKREIAQLREHLANLTGQVTAMQRSGTQPVAAPPQQADPVVQVEDELMALATKYEAGGMSASEYERQRIPLARKHAVLISQHVASGAVQQASRQPTAPAAASSDLYLEDQTRQMEDANPWVRNVPPELMVGLKPVLLRQLQERGIHAGDDARGNRNLRAAFVAYGREMRFPEIYGGGTEPAPRMAGPTAAPPPATPQHRLPVPANQPPQLGQRGAGPADPGGVSKEALLAMSPEDRLELMEKAPQVFARFASG